jgi:hypothetical protein
MTNNRQKEKQIILFYANYHVLDHLGNHHRHLGLENHHHLDLLGRYHHENHHLHLDHHVENHLNAKKSQ